MSETFEDTVVGAFNVLGYQATFAAVAARLGGSTTAAQLYDEFPSHDALAERWLAGQIPDAAAQAGVRSMFAELVSAVVDALDKHRDFGRAWLAAAPPAALLNLEYWKLLHDDAHLYFRTCLTVLAGTIALPPPLAMADVVDELADALCAAVAGLLGAWQADRSISSGRTRAAIDSVACLVDALLVRRAEYVDNSLLVHLHRLAGLPHDQFVDPLLRVLLPAARVERLGNAPALVELLRDLLPPHTPTQS